MSLEALITEAARALSDARKLFGSSPVNGRWPSPQSLVDGRQAVAEAGRAAASSWRGQAAPVYGSGNSKQLQWLDNTITADTQIASPFANAGQAVMDGAQKMDGLIAETPLRGRCTGPAGAYHGRPARAGHLFAGPVKPG